MLWIFTGENEFQLLPYSQNLNIYRNCPPDKFSPHFHFWEFLSGLEYNTQTSTKSINARSILWTVDQLFSLKNIWNPY